MSDTLEDPPGDPAHPPRGGFSRFWKLSTLSTKVSATYAASKVKRLFQGAEAAAASLDAANRKNAERIASTLGELKGAAMKLGQILSIQEDGLPKEFRSLLGKLQTQAPPMHPSFAIEIIERELKKKLDDVFASFERKPLASASLGQVHGARLRSGEDVVVKVQYPGIDESVASDLRIARPLVKGLALTGKSYDLREALEEVEARLLEETDYVHEAGNQEALAAGFAEHGRRLPDGRPEVVIPRVFREHSTKRIITMERLHGLHLDPFCEAAPDEETRAVARRALSHAFWIMELELGILHSDPHPGNFLFLGKTADDGHFQFEGQLGILDFGCVKIFPETFSRNYVRLMRACIARDDAAILDVYVDMGFLSAAEKTGERAKEWLIWTHLSVLPLVEDRPWPRAPEESWEKFTIDMHAGMRRAAWKVGIHMPRDAVYLNRVSLGVMCFWARLGGAENWNRILREHLAVTEKKLRGGG